MLKDAGGEGSGHGMQAILHLRSDMDTGLTPHAA